MQAAANSRRWGAAAMNGLADGFNESKILDELTSKQREVLDLLIQHKTSKEISRILGISPHTVDQRIMLARAKLKVRSRNEVAQVYSRLVAGDASGGGRQSPEFGAYEQPVYGFSDVADSVPSVQNDLRDDAAADIRHAVWTELAEVPEAMSEAQNEPYHHVLPEVFDGPHGTLLRLGAMFAISIMLILVGLGGLSMFAQLSTMFDR